jgi:hypothetical protein
MCKPDNELSSTDTRLDLMCKPDNELGSPDTRLDLSGCGDNIMIRLVGVRVSFFFWLFVYLRRQTQFYNVYTMGNYIYSMKILDGYIYNGSIGLVAWPRFGAKNWKLSAKPCIARSLSALRYVREVNFRP